VVVIAEVLHQIVPDFGKDLFLGHVAGVSRNAPHPNPEVSTEHKLANQSNLVKNRSRFE